MARPTTVNIKGKKVNLDPQVYFNQQGYCLLTLRDIESKVIERKDGNGSFTVNRLKLQFKGYSGTGQLTDQLSFREDIVGENFLSRGEPTLKARIYDVLGIKELPQLEVAETLKSDSKVDEVKSEGDFFDTPAELVESEETEMVDDKFAVANALPAYYGKSFIAVITRDNTSYGKQSNEGYLNIVPESLKALPTKTPSTGKIATGAKS